ncbi:MAG: HAMP domain-containing histidine kinase [Clostridiales bacterium]|nr:HAMP domain-containing histidine kinase [Clostridiales bacterium]
MSTSFRRLFSAMVAIILLSFAILGSAFLMLSYQFIVREKKDTMVEHANFVSAQLVRIMDVDLNRDDIFDASALSVATAGAEDVLFCNVDGVIRFSYTSQEEVNTLSGTVDQEVISVVLSEGSYDGMSTLDLYEKRHLVVAIPIYQTEQNGAESTLMGILLIAANMNSFSELWHSMEFAFLVTALVVLCIAFFFCWFSCRRSAKPMMEMTNLVNRFAMGEYELRVDPAYTKRTDEAGALANAFNGMADSIAASEQQRQEFVSDISHELKTPMTTIQGFADGLLDGTIPPEKERESLQLISNETRRLSRLVRRMLDASRLAAQTQAGPPQTQAQFDLNETVAKVIISLERKITQRGLDMDVQLPETATMVWGDADSITQVCYNLLDNAAKFAYRGTSIGFYVVPKGKKVYVTVRNIGETISAEELPFIFDRFHKSDRSRSLDKEGVGLGLYIVKTILSGIQESITVTSEDGVTEFVFTLTRAE